MTTIDYDFLNNELDFEVSTESDLKLYKDYYYKMCQAIFKKNAFRPTPSDIEQWVNNGYFEKANYLSCPVDDDEERINLFKRAIGLQLIYDRNNGRNTMSIDTDGKYDLCREAEECLNIIGLIQPVRF